MKTNRKRFFAVLLSLVMALTMLPGEAFTESLNPGNIVINEAVSESAPASASDASESAVPNAEEGEATVENETLTAPKSETQPALRKALSAPLRAPSSPSGGVEITNSSVSVWADGRWQQLNNGDTVGLSDRLLFMTEFDMLPYTLSTGNNSVTIKLPDGIKTVADMGGELTMGDGSSAGTYSVGADGTVTLVFNDRYTSMNASGDTVKGVFKFEGKINQDALSGGDAVTLDFSDKVKININVTHGNIGLTKKASAVNDEKGMADYTVSISSSEGTASGLNVIDISDNMQIIGDIRMEKNDVVSVIPAGSYQVTETGFRLPLEKMNAGETINLTYTAQLKNQFVGDIRDNNKITVSSTDSAGNVITKTAEATVDFKNSLVTKKGDYDGKNLNWKITVNSKRLDINGMKLSDFTGSAGDLEYKGEVTITGEDGKVVKTNLPYVFGANGENTRQQFIVTYSQSVEVAAGGSEYYYNMAKLGDIESGIEAVQAKGEQTLTKSGHATFNNAVTGADGIKTAPITWSVKLDASKKKIGVDASGTWTYIDRVQGGEANMQWITDEQLREMAAAFDSAASSLGFTKEDYTFSAYNVPNAVNPEISFDELRSSVKYYGFGIKFKKDLDKGKTLTFAYKTTANLTAAGGTKLRYKNNAAEISADGTENIKEEVTYDPEKADILTKSDARASGELTNHEFNAVDGILKWDVRWQIPVKIVSQVPTGEYAEKDYLIIERFPAGTKLLSVAALGKNWNKKSEYISDSNGRKIYFEYEEDSATGDVLKIRIPKTSIAEYKGLSDVKFSFEVKMDEALWPADKRDGSYAVAFGNTVTVSKSEPEQSNYITEDEATQTQNVTYDKFFNAIKKSGRFVEDKNLLNYTLDINERGEDLLEGGNELSLVDVLSYDNNSGAVRVDFTPSELKVAAYDKTAGSWRPLDKALWSYTITDETKGEQTKSVIRMTLPDNTVIRVSYRYIVTAPKNTPLVIDNVAELVGTGIGGQPDDKKIPIAVSESSGSANVDAIDVRKVDSSNFSSGINGAIFNLYQYDGTDYRLVTEGGSAKNFVSETFNGEVGNVHLNDMVYNRAYKLVEIFAPEGYMLSKEPYYFVITDTDKSKYPDIIPSDFKGDKLIGGKIVFFTNEKIKADEKIDISGSKTWKDEEDKDGSRPKNITVRLLADGETVDSRTVNAADGWKWEFKNLPKKKGEADIIYTVMEDAVEGYAVSYDGYDITNSYTPGEISVSVTKNWDDKNNQDGKRPNSVIVRLYADGSDTGKTLTLSEGNLWTDSFKGLPLKKAGVKIDYSVDEDAVDGYSKAITGSADTGFTITNSYTPETVDISGSKTWDDMANQDGKRPDSVTVRLFADGEKTDEKIVTASDGWKWEFKDKPKYHEGRLIRYSVSEEAIEGYTASYDGYNITNSYTPEKTDLAVTKSWDDNGNQDGKRPNVVTIRLLADGIDTGESLILSESNAWAGSFKNLDVKKSGKRIDYSVSEDAVSGYSSAVTGDAVKGFTITNSYTPETVDISGSKTWDDNDDQDGVRPENVTVRLFADGTEIDSKKVAATDGWKWRFNNLPKYSGGALISYSISEDTVDGYTTTYSGYDITNSRTPGKTSVTVVKNWADSDNQDGKRPNSVTVKLYADGSDTGESLILNAGNSWTGSFTGLAEKKAGKKIEYSVVEEAVAGYSSVVTGDAVKGFTITNSYTPETVDISGGKTWDDMSNQDGERPDSITVRLLADGTEIYSKKVSEAYGWKWEFKNLPKRKAGNLIVYSVIEDKVDGYTAGYSGYDIVNRHTPNETSVTVVKSWADSDNQDGKRPNSVTVKLYADGVDTGRTVMLSDGNGWMASFTGLAVNKAGEKIDYSVDENDVDGYSKTITGSADTGFTITNSYTPETVDISGIKTWDDNDDQDGKRPTSITVRLFADGTEVDSKKVTAANGWKWNFKNMPKYSGGAPISYSITEDAVDGYTSAYSGYNITNSYTPGVRSVSVVKSWADSDDQDGKRPNSVTVKLYADGSDTGKSLTLSDGNSWTGSFTGLADKKAGKNIEYSVAEETVAGYTAVIAGDVVKGFTITNSYTPETVDISGGKTWDDNDDQDGKRPGSITVRLLANGAMVDSKKVTAADGWKWEFKNLPKKKSGTDIIYSVSEEAIEAYSTTYSGYDITNSHTPGERSVTVVKKWADSDNQDGKRPNSVTVKLYADGSDTGKTVILSDGNGWRDSFTGLADKKAGKNIEYSVAEEAVAGYTAVIAGDADTGFTITNSYTPETVDISGIKTWDDNDDQDGKRPTSITVRLFADGTEVDSKKVTAANGWKWNFKNMPKYSGGAPISYSITEDAVDGYTTTYSGYDITNSRTPGKTSVTVVKNWADSDNQDGKRPNSVTVKLYADGTDTGKSLTLSDGNSWTGSFTGLAEKKAGKKIEYSVAEEAVAGYSSVVAGDAVKGFTITNSYTPETVDISGGKTWDDNDDQDGKRPGSITVRLLANGAMVDSKKVTAADGWKWEFKNLPKKKSGTDIIYSVSEEAIEAYSTTYSGYDITNSHTPGERSVTVVKKWADSDNQDGKRPNSVTVKLYADGSDTGESLILNAGNSWTGSFTGLADKKAGKNIEYSVAEETVAGYTAVIEGDAVKGFTITNSYTPETVDISGIKTWDDNDDQDGKRPTSITVRLFADGTEIDSKKVTASDGWKWSFNNLPKNDKGKEIVYSLTEDSIDGYTTAYSGYNITNSYTPGVRSVSVVKNWADSDNQDGKRPSAVTVKLYADGSDTGKSLTLSDGNSWTGAFTGLAVKKAGKNIEYSVAEETVAGYTAVVTGDASSGYKITNSYTPEVADISGIKIWNDNGNYAGIRPANITIRLLADGKETAKMTVTAADGWRWDFKNMPKYSGGKPINYSITEDAVAGYSTNYSGYNAVNSYTPGKTSVSVSKRWLDSDDEDEIRPDSIEVKLYADGADTGNVLKLSSGNNWTGSFTGLDYSKVYSIAETEIVGYVSSIGGSSVSGFTITNSHNPQKEVMPPPAKQQGSLKISKTVKGDLGDKNQYFLFEVVFDDDGSYPYIGSSTGYISSGEKIALKHGESVTINDLPAGIKYSVIEKNNKGYTLYSKGEKGKIKKDKTVKAEFTNLRSSVPKTGDYSDMGAWIALMAASLAGMFAALFGIRKNEKK